MPSILQLQHRATCDRYDPDAYLTWCQALVARGQIAYAADIFDRWQHIDPDNSSIAYHRSILLQSQAPLRAPSEYLIFEFDEFADSFDGVLAGLGYVVPRRFGELLSVHMEGRSARVLDLGCGTGLCGVEARPYAAYLCGVDLSPGMLDRARQRGIYDALVEDEIGSYLKQCEDKFDLVLAGDSLIYFGELSSVLGSIRTVMRPNGLIIFSLEMVSDELTYFLSCSGRYQHSRAYVEATLRESGYMVVSAESPVLRNENGLPVNGVIVVASNPG
jgi:predicted TPR repeat methyltransferase